MLHLAAKRGNIEVVHYMLDDHSNRAKEVLNAGREGGRTPLIAATFAGHDAIVDLLLEAGAAVDKSDDDGFTPLHWAARKGYTRLVRTLVETGKASTNVRSADGATPLHCAALAGNADIVHFLLNETDADASIKADSGATALEIASRNGMIEIVRAIMKGDPGAARTIGDEWMPPPAQYGAGTQGIPWLPCHGDEDWSQFWVK